jgi:hypothetical protein
VCELSEAGPFNLIFWWVSLLRSLPIYIKDCVFPLFHSCVVVGGIYRLSLSLSLSFFYSLLLDL